MRLSTAPRTILRTVPLIAGILIVAACSDVRPTGTEVTRATVTSASPDGATDPVQTSISRMAELVSIALVDGGLRHRVKADLRKAPYFEHKLELSSYVHGASGGVLLAKVAQRTDVSRDEFLQILDTAPPLELYMPVDAHRLTWTGTDDVVVASQLDEGDPIRAFSLGGEPVRLTDEAAPERPVLALVPVETNYADPIDTSEFINRDRANGRAIGVYGRVSVSANNCVLECGGGSGGTDDPDGPLLDPRWEDRSEGVWL